MVGLIENHNIPVARGKSIEQILRMETRDSAEQVIVICRLMIIEEKLAEVAVLENLPECVPCLFQDLFTVRQE